MGQLLAAQDLLQQWLFDGLTGVTPQLVFSTALGDHDPAEGVLWRWSGGRCKARGGEITGITGTAYGQCFT